MREKNQLTIELLHAFDKAAYNRQYYQKNKRLWEDYYSKGSKLGIAGKSQQNTKATSSVSNSMAERMRKESVSKSKAESDNRKASVTNSMAERMRTKATSKAKIEKDNRTAAIYNSMAERMRQKATGKTGSTVSTKAAAKKTSKFLKKIFG